MSDVNTPPVSPEGEVATIPPTVPGEKTEPALLLKSLQEERDKRREAEAELKRLQDTLASGDTLSEEGKVLKAQITNLEGTISTMEKNATMKELQTEFPALKDKSSEFENYLKENEGMSLKTAAKSFLIDNNLMDVPPVRKGIEKPSGGGRNATPQGWTFTSIEEVRKNNFRRYSQLLKEGAFKDVTE